MMWRYCKLPFYQFTSFLHFYTVWYGLVIFFWLTNKSLLFTIYPARNLASHFSILYIYRSLFFIMLLYFLKMVQSFHIKFFYICFYIWYMFLVLLGKSPQKTFEAERLLLQPILGYFGSHFGESPLISGAVQSFLIKVFTDVFCITPMATALKKLFYSIPFCRRLFWGKFLF